jgi:hypothetical protein
MIQVRAWIFYESCKIQSRKINCSNMHFNRDVYTNQFCVKRSKFLALKVDFNLYFFQHRTILNPYSYKHEKTDCPGDISTPFPERVWEADFRISADTVRTNFLSMALRTSSLCWVKVYSKQRIKYQCIVDLGSVFRFEALVASHRPPPPPPPRPKTLYLCHRRYKS